MSVYREDVLATRFAALAPDSLPGDWLDVQRRVRRGHRRRLLTIAIAAAIAAILVASALALRSGGIDFFSADPAPHRVVLQFKEASRSLRVNWGIELPAVRRELRTVLSMNWRDGTSLSLAVAPMRDRDGFCRVTFDPAEGRVWGEGCIDAKERRSQQIMGAVPLHWAGVDEHGANLGYYEFVGILTAPRTERLVVRYEDGKQDEVPFTWVSKPIDAGFFAFDPAPRHFGKGHRASAFVALDAKGHEIARFPFEYEPPPDPRWIFPMGPGMPPAIDSATVHQLRTPQLPRWLWVSVGRGKAGGVCYRIGYGIGGGCVKPGARPECCTFGGTPGKVIWGRRRSVLLVGGITAPDATVELSFEDGRTIVVRPREQVVMFAIPPEQYPADHHLVSAVLKDGSGRVVNHWEIDKSWGYPVYHHRPVGGVSWG